MREILFRGKTKKGEWIYGDLITHGIDFDDAIKQHHTREVWDIIPETIGQYTGLTDKNGKKIFEGDIVKEKACVHNGEIQIKGEIYEVKLYKGSWAIVNSDYWDFLYTQKDVEVIGSIHDNFELLEVGE